jgi:NADPH:quinone reductase-like Zn-dependent oxidoreductase
MAEITMKAIHVQDYGGSDVLVLETVPRPQATAEQVLIRLKYAGVNPTDWVMREGGYKQFMPLQFPWTPGLEGAGVVESVGANVSKFKQGQEVYGIFSGGYAEYAVASANDIQPKPSQLSFEEAASVPMGALTAWGALFVTAALEKGQRVLVHGAAGGVGIYAVQLARWKGAQVTGTASAGNLELVKSLGVVSALDYKAAPFETIVKDMDVVIDTVGGDIQERSFKVLRPNGIYVTVAGRPSEEAAKAAGVRAMSGRRAPLELLSQISELLESKKLTPVVGKVFPLSEARQAQELSKTGHGRGRILLRMP